MFLIVDNVRTVECPVVDCSRRPDQPHKMHGCRLHSEYRCIPRHSKIKSNKKNQDYGDVCVRETQQGRLTIMRKQFFNAKGNLGKKCFQLAFESVCVSGDSHRPITAQHFAPDQRCHPWTRIQNDTFSPRWSRIKQKCTTVENYRPPFTLSSSSSDINSTSLYIKIRQRSVLWPTDKRTQPTKRMQLISYVKISCVTCVR